MTDTALVYFSVSDFGPDPATVTAALGLAPTRAWVKPARAGHGSRSRWELDSPLAPAASPVSHLRALLELLEPRAEQVLRLARRFPAAIYCSVRYETEAPSIELPPELLDHLAALHLGIHLDLDFVGHEPPDQDPD